MSILTVGISDLAVSNSPDILATYALGSCVGICLFDRNSSIGGLSHIMLPSSKEVSLQKDNLKKYADTGIIMLLKQMQSAGADISSVTAKIAGGAQMFATTSANLSIGERNVSAVKSVLQHFNIQIKAEQTGSNFGRTLFFHTDTGMVEVKSAIKGTVII